MKRYTTLLMLILSLNGFSQIGILDILELNANFGQPIPDVQPDFFGYYQDITGGFDSFTNESNVQGVDITPDDTQYTFIWRLKACEDCEPYAEYFGYEIPFNEMFAQKGICEGGFWVTLVCQHEDGAQFENTKPVWAFWGGVDYLDCEFGVGLFDHFNYPLRPKYSAYQYQTSYSYWDFNQNNVRDTADLIKLLELYGQ
jgi:hypothetical protein